VDDGRNASLEDNPIAEEADLVMHLMAVCNRRNRPLTRGEIDAALGRPSLSPW